MSKKSCPAYAVDFGLWLFKRRTQLGLTLREAAAQGHYSFTVLSELERGLVDPLNLKIRTIWCLAKIYKIAPWALLQRLGFIYGSKTKGVV